MPNINKINNTLENNSLTLKNKLKTTLQICNENSLEYSKIPSETENLYSYWCLQLNRTPKYDLYEPQALNKVNQKQKPNKYQVLKKYFQTKNWDNQVEHRLRKLGFKA